MANEKVYIVHWGDGNEWDEIGGVFSTLAKAKEWCLNHSGVELGWGVWWEVDGLCRSSLHQPPAKYEYTISRYEIDAGE